MTTLQVFSFVVEEPLGQRFDVTFLRHSTGRLSARCSCQPGLGGTYCHHRIRLLEGDTTGLVSGNQEEVEVLQWWVAGSDLKQAVARVHAAERTGRRGKASPMDVFAHWPDLTASDFMPASEDVAPREADTAP